MIFIGGVTRLTDSGLSIVEWKPVTGIIPPLSEYDWLQEFDKYKTSPEYNKINLGMSLKEFKFIYFLEYFHRVLGRLTGFIFFIPLIFFAIKKAFPRNVINCFIGIGILGAIQGFIGWYMVKSGLIDNPHVSQYRLALHLGTAIIILGIFCWIYLIIKYLPKKFDFFNKYSKLSLILVTWVFLQILTGAFVAGLDAGLIYNTFPLMNGKFIPDEILHLNPWWINFLENHASVQFLHRISSYGLFIFSLVLYFKILRLNNKTLCKTYSIFVVLLVAQMILGIITLLYQVPVAFGSLHQINGVLVFIFANIIFFNCLTEKSI
ncbi:MAG: COX15/CtaA family protein [Sphingobacteriia bacterium]|nr:COX15/CtaA family protein [Sphingobacteriia bacterium]